MPEAGRRLARWRSLALFASLLVSLSGCDRGADGPPGTLGTSDPPVFVDVTDDVGLTFHQRTGATGEFYFPEIMAPGGGLFDYDGDGDLDLYCVQGGSPLGETGGSPPPTDRLFRNDLIADAAGGPRLRFTDVTAASGIEAAGYGMGAAAGDIDNDGFVDLYVANFGSNQLWRNRGDGSFADVTVAAGVDDPRWSTSAAFLDFDRDGFLDLFVANYVDFRVEAHKRCTAPSGRPDYCAPGSYRGEPDRLLRNRGNGTFEDVTGRSGILAHYGNGLGVVSADFDGDGWIDVFVANDQQPNFLWLNRRDGRFEEGALLAGVAVNLEGRAEASMGVDAGDVDNDGDEDLFMTHLTGETNTFYDNLGDALFEDRTYAAQLGLASVPFTGFGTAFLDFDSDGWLDILAVNGAVHEIEGLARQGHSFPFAQRDQLFRNRGDGRFEDVSASAGPALAAARVSRGLAVGDLDNDGDIDAVVFNADGPARVLVNPGAPTRWIGFRLLAGKRDALGARVEVVLGSGERRWRRARSDGSYLSANDPRVLVGLGREDGVKAVRVFWPDGRSEQWSDPPLGRYSQLVEGEGRLLADPP